MTDERVFKDEPVRNVDQEMPWYHLSGTTWLLIGSLAIYNLVCLACPEFFDQILRLVDVRLWPWWYFPCLIIVNVFSVQWFFHDQKRDKYDDLERKTARHFNRMSVAVTVLFGVLIVMNMFNATSRFHHTLNRWFGYEKLFWMALAGFVLILTAVAIVGCFFKTWRSK